MLIACEWLGELVGHHVLCRGVDQLDGLSGDLLPYEVMPDVNVLGALMMLRFLARAMLP